MRGWVASGACFLAGLACFAALPWMAFQTQYLYLLKEPCFSNPVSPYSSAIFLRSDKYGKGHFGASRNGGRKHQGIDLLSKLGNPVFASKSGRVSFAGMREGYGICVEISHLDRFSTRYAHLSQFLVSTGDWVQQGTAIGLSGKTGNADNKKIRPHVHFEIRYGGIPLDPSAGLMSP
jgi:murein DD-endopeptidase MepM/ murein hydrolase activator NlpD